MSSPPRKFPVVFCDRGVTAKVYRSVQRKGCRRYTSFALVWHTSEGRRRKVFADYAKAATEAALVITAVINGRTAAATIGSSDAETFAAARRLAQQIGKPLLACLEEHLAATKALDGRATFAEAVAAWRRQNGADLVAKSAAEVWAEFKAEKTQEGCSKFYLKPLGSRFRSFARAFPGPLHGVTAQDFDAWLRKAAASMKDRNHKRDAVVTVARFARARGYLPTDGPLELARVAKVRIRDRRSVQIYTPAELSKVLFAGEHEPLRSEIVPFVVLGAFAAIRPRELQRLNWSDVRLADRIIEIRPAAAKTASRRLVPISDNLAAWLQPYADRTGPVVTVRDPRDQLLKRYLAVGVPSYRNGLRHSAISYRVGLTQNVASTALEAGNSPQVVFRNYREAVTKSAAAEWFSISPV